MINRKLTPRGGESKPLKDRLVLTLFLKRIVTGTYIRFDFSSRHRCRILRITDQRCEINDVESVTEPLHDFLHYDCGQVSGLPLTYLYVSINNNNNTKAANS